MRLKISHITRYEHSNPVSYGLMELRLAPSTNANQNVLDWAITLDGAQEELRFTDQHGNAVMLVSYSGQPHTVTIGCEGTVETRDAAGVSGEHKGNAPLWYYKRTTPLTKPGPLTRALVRDTGTSHESSLARLHALSARITSAIRYTVGATHVQTTAEEALEHREGVCQDHAHVMISAARLLGHPARYVSGYLMMNDRVEQEAGHAWAEVHVDGLGWVGFDPSNSISPDARYVMVACGLDAREAAPVRGLHHVSHDGHENNVLVNIQVQQ